MLLHVRELAPLGLAASRTLAASDAVIAVSDAVREQLLPAAPNPHVACRIEQRRKRPANLSPGVCRHSPIAPVADRHGA